MCCKGRTGKRLFAEWEQSTAAAAGQESKVPDANETTREHMQQETTQELIGRQSEESFLVFVSGVSPAKRDLVIQEGNEPAIGDRHPMRISAEVAQHLLGPAEGRLAVDHPSRRIKLTDQTPKQFGLSHAAKQAVKPELSGSVSLLERFEKLAAEDFAENPFRKKEAIISRAHPMGMVARQTAGSDDAVDMGMVLQLLIPGMENAEEADLGAEAFAVCGNFDESLCARAEQQSVDHLLVL
jgi:hypothetical protein